MAFLANLRGEELSETCASSALLSHSFGVCSPVKLMEGMKFVALMAFTPVLLCHSHQIAFRISGPSWPYLLSHRIRAIDVSIAPTPSAKIRHQFHRRPVVFGTPSMPSCTC